MAGPSGPGTVVLELGADVGALVLLTPAELDGREIEISRDAGPGRPAHAFTGAAPAYAPAGTKYAAVYPDLPAGAYTIWADEQRQAGRVVITGGRVANWSWPGRTPPVAGLNPPWLLMAGQGGSSFTAQTGSGRRYGSDRQREGHDRGGGGLFEPPAGSTVRPSLSPLTIPVATTGVVTPFWAVGSRPAETIFTGPISHSW